ncbi:MAG TPA: hypothetical protein VKU41_09190, partial [Polyangiaceae bacterium]|nr:hypothetical protein [Polyangiaceae bacterium]
MSARRVIVVSLVAAATGLALLVVGIAVDPSRAAFAFLDAWTFGVTICVGALLLLMAAHASKGSWMVVIRRPVEAVVGALPLYVLLFVPIAFAVRRLYPWANASAQTPELQAAIAHKQAYLSPWFFFVRTAFYFAVFILMGVLLRVWSKRNDARPSMRTVIWMRRLSGGGLPVVGLVLTWAAFDWTMSLEPDWYSTIFGLYYFAGAFVGAIALTSVMLHLSRLRTAPRDRVTPDHAQALGRILFAMVIFWAYMAFSQLLIYWIGDIPEEVSFFGLRTTGSWAVVTGVLVCGMFVAPFFALLNRLWKRRTPYLAIVGAWVFVMHYVDVYWMVLPMHDAAGARPHWLDGAS